MRARERILDEMVDRLKNLIAEQDVRIAEFRNMALCIETQLGYIEESVHRARMEVKKVLDDEGWKAEEVDGHE